MSEPRVAVIAIHGVGDHQPFEMAKSVSALLEDLEDLDRGRRVPRYGAFMEHAIRINVAPVNIAGHGFQSPAPAIPAAEVEGKPAPRIREAQSWGPMGALYDSEVIVDHPAEATPRGLDHLFLEGQLAKFKGDGPEETYETLRLEGKRRANAALGLERETGPGPSSGVPETEVHVYDMLWADLSGVRTTGLRIFGEIYQLTLHLASIGVNNVKAAAIFLTKGKLKKEPALSNAWKRFNNAQVSAAAILAWPIPLLNLLMLAFALGIFVDATLVRFSVRAQIMATSMALLAVLAGACGYAMRRTGRWSQAGYRFPVLAFLTLTAATVFVLFFMGIPSSSVVVWNEWIESIATTLSELAFFALLWAVVGAYDKLRPGAKVAFGVMVGLVVVVSLALPGTSVLASTNFVAMAILLRLLEVAFLLLLASWLAFWIAIIWAFLTGSLAVWATAKHAPAERQRAAHTNWTARLTIALPSVLFLLLTFAGWAGLMKVSMPLLPHDASVTDKDCPAQSVRDTSAPFKSALCVSPLVPFGSKPRTIQTWTEETLAKAGIGFIPLLLLLVCLAALISVWALAPSILGEVSPPSGSTRDLHKESESLGRWLTDGFTFMRWAGRILYLGVLSFPLGILLAWLYVVHPDWPAVQKYASLAKPFSWALGAIVAGTAVGLLGFGGRLSKLALGFRPAIRVGLDVDNWLREHPRESNPTARICGRYVSLLRYIAQWKAADGRGYDKLVIFSHSQGTIVTADLLRFLNVERLNSETRTYSSYDPLLQGLEKMEIQLFTMGCPLRQLYGLRFPYLYGYAPTGYASDSTSKSKSTIAPDSQGAGAASDSDSADDLMPKPDDLGVDKWVNAYRTGDYVGRHLWKDNPWQPVEGVRFSDWDPPQGLPQHIWTKGKRVEFSIGPGAHTHYWDSTAEAIAETLDILVAKP